VAFAPPDGDIVPVPVFIYVSITNRRQTPVSIERYDVAIGKTPNGPWYRMCNVRPQTRKIYFMLDTIHASEIDRKNFLDELLPGTVLSPAVPVSGWTAWRCPVALGPGCLSDFFLFTIEDSTGTTSQYSVPFRREYGTTTAGGEFGLTGKRVNLSGLKWNPGEPCGVEPLHVFPP
jgi:hypothetical protein